jgi:N-carbamoyl-L-amino-acid hydrolase
MEQFDQVGRTATGINRLAYSDADIAGRAFVQQLMRNGGLEPRIDAAGNMFGVLPGSEPLPPILTGSHIDSVVDGGNFDGTLGVFAAIEVARTLSVNSVRLRHPLHVVAWQNEEGGTVGSRIAAGTFNDAELNTSARSGFAIREGIARIGGDPERLHEARLSERDVACYLELHIEQGGVLEKSNARIGVVEGIVGLRWFEITVAGAANHAGTTPMDQRQDAMLATAKFTVAVNDAIRSESGRQVATIGRVVPSPNTMTAIPGQVVFTLDFRDMSVEKLDRIEQQCRALASEIGQATGTQFAFRQVLRSRPAPADPRLMQWIDDSAAALKLSRMRVPSGAGHDAMELARIAPMGMIFVPSVGGISHSPLEFTAAEDIVNGANVLLNAVFAADEAL